MEPSWQKARFHLGFYVGYVTVATTALQPREPVGSRQAIVIHHTCGLLLRGSDQRKDGTVLGY